MADIKLVKWTRDVYEPSDDSFLLVDALQARLSSPRRGADVDAARPPTPSRSPPSYSSSSSSSWPRVAVEIGCGSGYVITSLALLLRSRDRGGAADGSPPHATTLLLATDVSAPALASTRETLAAHGLRAGADVELVQGDLAEPLRGRLRGAVDLLVREDGVRSLVVGGGGRVQRCTRAPPVASTLARATHTLPLTTKRPFQIFNPPYVPTPDDEVVAPVLAGTRRAQEQGNEESAAVGGRLGVVAAAWAGGDRGRRVVDRLLPQLRELLSDEGEAFVVAVQENDPEGMISAVVGEEEGAVAVAEAPGCDDGVRRRRADDVNLQRGRRRAPLKGEVVLRRAADEEALCILRFYRAPADDDGGDGGGR